VGSIGDDPEFLFLAHKFGNAKAGPEVESAFAKLIAYITNFFASAPASLTAELQAVHAFLDGRATLEGVAFGERHPDKTGAFWWRKNLRAAIESAITQPGEGE
jgi:hypothetical protein